MTPATVSFTFTIWLFNIAMENGPFLDDVPIKTSIYKGFSMAMLNNQMVPSTSGTTSACHLSTTYSRSKKRPGPACAGRSGSFLRQKVDPKGR